MSLIFSSLVSQSFSKFASLIFTNFVSFLLQYKKEFLIVVLALNVISFATMAIDKNKAKHHLWRIPESTLWLEALCFGGIGSILGMWLFHHKNKKLHFVVGFLVLSFAQIVFICYILGK